MSQSRLNPSTSTQSSNSSTSTSSGGAGSSNSAVQNQMGNASSSGSDTPVLSAAQQARPTDRVPTLNADAFKTCTPAGIGSRVRLAMDVWNSEQVKDGQSLNAPQLLYIACDTMFRQGLSQAEVSSNIQQLFFSEAPGYDEYGQVQFQQGQVSVTFVGNVQPLVCTAPQAYGGLDDNQREDKAETMASGMYKSDQGWFMGVEETFMSNVQLMDSLFEADANNRMFVGAPKNSAYRDAWQEWLNANLVPRYMVAGVGWVTSQLPSEQALQGMTPAQVLQVVLQAAMTFTNGAVGARPHTTVEIQDEALAKVVMESLGYDVNVDSDALQMSQVVRNDKANKIGVAASTQGSGASTASTPSTQAGGADLPVHTQLMDAIDGMRASPWLGGDAVGKNEHGLYVGTEAGFYKKLPAEGRLQWDAFGFDDLPSLQASGHRLSEQAELDAFKVFLDAWYTSEQALVKGEAAEAECEALDAAAEAFKASL